MRLRHLGFYAHEGDTPENASGSAIETGAHKRNLTGAGDEGQAMYVVMVLLLLAILPAGSVIAEHSYLHSTAPLVFLIGKWFTFWAAGVRLFLAGLRQTITPRFTAQEIFKLSGTEVFPLVREVGFANLSMSALSLLSLYTPVFLIPGALVGGLYYFFAGIGHTMAGHRNFKETFAMATDFLIAIVLLGFVAIEFAASGFAALPNQ
jgi:hypothetical protein